MVLNNDKNVILNVAFSEDGTDNQLVLLIPKLCHLIVPNFRCILLIELFLNMFLMF